MLSATFDFDRNGFNVLLMWLNVRPAAASGAMFGLRGLASVIGSGSRGLSSIGVMNGSSGGCCCTTGSVLTDGYDLKDGVGALGATHSVDKAGSIAIAGTTADL